MAQAANHKGVKNLEDLVTEIQRHLLYSKSEVIRSLALSFNAEKCTDKEAMACLAALKPLIQAESQYLVKLESLAIKVGYVDGG